jgi:hypothetical protein
MTCSTALIITVAVEYNFCIEPMCNTERTFLLFQIWASEGLTVLENGKSSLCSDPTCPPEVNHRGQPEASHSDLSSDLRRTARDVIYQVQSTIITTYLLIYLSTHAPIQLSICLSIYLPIRHPDIIVKHGFDMSFYSHCSHPLRRCFRLQNRIVIRLCSVRRHFKQFVVHY